jgi:hypothetical protein
MHFLKHVGLDEKLVETLACLLGAHLLNGSEERVRLVQSVQEADGLVNGGGVVLPQVEQLKSLLKVIQPRSETSGGHPGLLGPLSADSHERDVLHQIFHSGSHGQLSLESEIKVLKVGDNLLDEGVDQLTLLQVHILVRTTARLIRQLAVDFIYGQLLGLDLSFLENSVGEVLGDIDNGWSTIRAATTVLGLELNKDSEQVNALGSEEINFGVGMHSEGERGLCGQFVLNLLKVLAVSSTNGALERCFAFSEGEELSFVKQCVVHEVLQVSSA